MEALIGRLERVLLLLRETGLRPVELGRVARLAARTVVAVRQELAVEVPSPLPQADPERLRAFGERWGVASPVERLIAQL